MRLAKHFGISGMVKRLIAVGIIGGLLFPPQVYSAQTAGLAQRPAGLEQVKKDLLVAAGSSSELRDVRVGFGQPVKFYTNSIASYWVGNLFNKPVEQIPDEVVNTVRTFLSQHVKAGRLKSFFVHDFGGNEIYVHVTHNYGERNASVHRIMLDAVREGLEKAKELDLVDVNLGELSSKELAEKLNVAAADDSKVERGAESVVVAKGIGVSIGAANIKLFHEFVIPGATPLKKLGLKKSPGFRFRVKRTQDILASKFDADEWEFEISEDQRDNDGKSGSYSCA